MSLTSMKNRVCRLMQSTNTEERRIFMHTFGGDGDYQAVRCHSGQIIPRKEAETMKEFRERAFAEAARSDANFMQGNCLVLTGLYADERNEG